MMSGGVDSSVAALLLAKNKKYEVVGCFIKGYNIDGCQEADSEDARRTAEFLKIPFYVIDLENEYKKLVVDYMIDGYRKGITPNPDVMCNREIKFGLFLKKALEMGAPTYRLPAGRHGQAGIYVATGHYVRLRRITIGQMSDVRCQMFAAKDGNKDQSYFLWTLTQKQLRHCLFPIGDYLKSEVREIARKAGLPTAEKKDSQGICFLGMVKFKDFLRQYLPVKRGDVLNIEGKKIGEHDGVWFYTIGQRHIGISGKKPYYIAEKNIKKNILTAAEGENNPVLYKKEIKLTDVNFLNPLIFNTKYSIPVMARVRYRQPLAPAALINCRKLSVVSCKLIFDRPVKFVAAGQSAVFYSAKSEMLGGGIIVNFDF